MFDRKQTAREIIGALSDGEIDSISGLKLKAAVFAEFTAELRSNLTDAYSADSDDQDSDEFGGDGEHDPTGAVSAIVDSIVPTYGGEVLRYFNNIDAAFEIPLSDVEYDPDKDVCDFLISVLEAVYESAVTALIVHIEELVDEAEQEADEAALDDETDETTDED